jgi:hypothetical protein
VQSGVNFRRKQNTPPGARRQRIAKR